MLVITCDACPRVGECGADRPARRADQEGGDDVRSPRAPLPLALAPSPSPCVYPPRRGCDTSSSRQYDPTTIQRFFVLSQLVARLWLYEHQIQYLVSRRGTIIDRRWGGMVHARPLHGCMHGCPISFKSILLVRASLPNRPRYSGMLAVPVPVPARGPMAQPCTGSLTLAWLRAPPVPLSPCPPPLPRTVWEA